MRRAIVHVEGVVQGVGFRWWVQQHAQRLGVTGSAVNRPDGTVEVDAQGDPDAVDELVRLLVAPRAGERRPGTVTGTRIDDRAPEPDRRGFRTR